MIVGFEADGGVERLVSILASESRMTPAAGGDDGVGIDGGVAVVVGGGVGEDVLVDPQASRKTTRALADSPSAAARMRNSRRFSPSRASQRVFLLFSPILTPYLDFLLDSDELETSCRTSHLNNQSCCLAAITKNSLTKFLQTLILFVYGLKTILYTLTIS